MRRKLCILQKMLKRWKLGAWYVGSCLFRNTQKGGLHMGHGMELLPWNGCKHGQIVKWPQEEGGLRIAGLAKKALGSASFHDQIAILWRVLRLR